MDTHLQLELGKILVGAATAGLGLNMQIVATGATSVVIGCPAHGTSLILGVIHVTASTPGISKLLDSICVAYMINVRKWAWAEMEGFDIDGIIDKLGKEVFQRIELHEILPALCNEKYK